MNTAFSFTAFFFPDGNTYQEKFLNAKYNGRDGNLFNKENLIKTTKALHGPLLPSVVCDGFN